MSLPLWTLIVPLKPLRHAKSRLAPVAGLLRPELALAFAQDTVAAALGCAAVARVLVVTDDPRAAGRLAALGATTVPDRPAAGLNAALAHGAEAARTLPGMPPGGWVAALSADLPALRPEELGRVLDAAAAYPRAFLADTQQVGTTLLGAAPGQRLGPRFEGASRLRHRASGAHELTLDDVPTVRRDVDTPDDLRAAVLLGLGPHTSALTLPATL